MLQQTNTGN